MDILQVGPWVLLLIGTIILLGAVWSVLKGKQAKSVWLMWVFGFAASGVGIYGPSFLTPYAEFVKTLTQLQSSPSPESYAEAMQKVADGEFSTTFDSIIVSLALSQPVEGMDSLLQLSKERARDPQREKILAGAQDLWRRRQAAARELGQGIQQSPEAESKLESLDPVTKILVAKALLLQPTTPHIDPEVLRKHATFPAKKK